MTGEWGRSKESSDLPRLKMGGHQYHGREGADRPL